MSPGVLERFMAKVEKQAAVTSPHVDTPCWLWIASTNNCGYGVLGVERRPTLAHRLAVEHWTGPIPTGLCVCHRCDEPSCVNPDHLRVGSHAENMAEMIAKGRAVAPPRLRGARNANAKLTADQVREIRRRYAAGGVSQRVLAAEFGVGKSTIHGIIARKKWAHLPAA